MGAGRKQRVLLLEDEAVLRQSQARALRGLGEIEVLEAGTMREALARVDEGGVDVAVCDIDLPDRAGIEIIGELAARKLHVPIIFASAYLKAYRAQIPPNARVEVLEKPVPIEELRGRVRRHLAAGESSAPFSVPDYVQLACLGNHSVVISVEAPTSRGELWIVAGDAWTAFDAAGEGAPAFCRLCFVPNAEVRVRTFAGEPPPRTIDRSWEGLLLEAAHLEDEARRAAPVAPSAVGASFSFEPPPESPFRESASPALASTIAPPAVAAASNEAPADDPIERAFSEAWDRGIDALLAKDYGAAAAAFAEARTLRPRDPKVAANLKRLSDLGYPAPERTGG